MGENRQMVRLQAAPHRGCDVSMAFKLTKASASNISEGHALVDQLKERQSSIVETAETLAADHGYDDTKLIVKCWDDHQIKLVIDIRNMWRDPDKTSSVGRLSLIFIP